MPLAGVVARNAPPATEAPAHAGAVAVWGVTGAASSTAPSRLAGIATATPTVVRRASQDEFAEELLETIVVVIQKPSVATITSTAHTYVAP
jgi:hypothetical protein